MTTEWRKAGRFSFWAMQGESTMLLTRIGPHWYEIRINGEFKAVIFGKTEAMQTAATYAQ